MTRNDANVFSGADILVCPGSLKSKGGSKKDKHFQNEVVRWQIFIFPSFFALYRYTCFCKIYFFYWHGITRTHIVMRFECLDTTRFAWGQKLREREREAERPGRRGSRLKKEDVSGQPRRHSAFFKNSNEDGLGETYYSAVDTTFSMSRFMSSCCLQLISSHTLVSVAGHGNGIIIRLQWGRRGLSIRADTDCIRHPGWTNLLLVLSYVMFGVAFLTTQQNWQPVTALYVVVQIVTTIGYGDITVTNEEKIFMTFYVLLGTVLVAKVVNDVSEAG